MQTISMLGVTLDSETTVGLSEISKSLPKKYGLAEAGEFHLSEHFYDTFDWGLYEKGCILKRIGSSFQLLGFNEILQIEDKGPRRSKLFSTDFSLPEMQKKLARFTGIRALLSIAEVERTNRLFAVLNKEEKTVARITVQERTAIGTNVSGILPTSISLESVRGYEKSFKKIQDGFMQLGFTERTDVIPELNAVLHHINRTPLDYDSKVSLVLTEKQPLNTSIQTIFRYLLGGMSSNYDGVVKDIDVEFLHDFRIAIRRTRSLLSLMKEYIPVQDLLYFQNEFKWLGSITGPVRDLDVCLLEKDNYVTLLPDTLQDGLEYFFQSLKAQRFVELKTLQKHLRSKRYETLIKDWQRFLSKIIEPGHNLLGEKKTGKVVRKIVSKKFEKIIVSGGDIDDSSPDENLHVLRIKGKKFRYLLEFFQSILGPDETAQFLKQLKRLQNNLGDFNDLSVQQEMLLKYQNEQLGRTKQDIYIAMSLGGLISALALEHQHIRRKFEKTFRNFSSGENLRLMAELNQ